MHTYDCKATDDKYLKTPATCNKSAEYYYSCVCGATGTDTFESGEYAPHTYGEWSRKDEECHVHACTCCGELEEAKHTWDEGAITLAPTYVSIGLKQQTCTACGATKTVEIPKLEAQAVKIPDADTAQYIYTGNEITYILEENDAYTVIGNKQTNAGTYTVTVSLKDKNATHWANGSTEELTYTFVIEKADYDMSQVVIRDVVAIENGRTFYVVAENVPNGVVASYSINGVKDPGEYLVTVSFTVDDNHNPIPDRTAKIQIAEKKHEDPAVTPPAFPSTGFIVGSSIAAVFAVSAAVCFFSIRKRKRKK